MSPFTEKRFLPKLNVKPEEREQLIKKITDRLLLKKDIVFAYIHGSFLTSESFRDIDIGIFVSTAKDFIFESDISYELSSALGYEVEVRIINNAPAAFQMSVLRDGKVLFSRDEALRSDFIENVGRKYRDYAHFRNIFMEAVSDHK